MAATRFIGIAGGSASGKSSIARQIRQVLGEKAFLVELDSYYRPYRDLDLAERRRMNFDHPDAFEMERLVEDLKKLRSGEAVDMPLYDYVAYTRKEETRRVEPHPVILAEGLLVLYDQALRDMLDLKVFVEADSDERLMRRIRRDTVKRGRSLDSVLTQYQQTVKPMHEQFVEPSKKYADIIIPRGAKNERGVAILMNYLEKIASEK